jgi:hypothetical protein
MNIYHRILLYVIILFAMMFVGIWLFNHVYAWFGVAAIVITIYAAVRMAIQIINILNKNDNEK